MSDRPRLSRTVSTLFVALGVIKCIESATGTLLVSTYHGNWYDGPIAIALGAVILVAVGRWDRRKERRRAERAAAATADAPYHRGHVVHHRHR